MQSGRRAVHVVTRLSRAVEEEEEKKEEKERSTPRPVCGLHLFCKSLPFIIDKRDARVRTCLRHPSRELLKRTNRSSPLLFMAGARRVATAAAILT